MNLCRLTRQGQLHHRTHVPQPVEELRQVGQGSRRRYLPLLLAQHAQHVVQVLERGAGRLLDAAHGGPRQLAAVAAALVVMTLSACSHSTVVATDSSASEPDPVQQALGTLVSDDDLPAALASVQDRNGRTRTYTAGVGDLATGSQVPEDGQVRIGSNTKTFTAVVVMQLVTEGRVYLDAPVDLSLIHI